MSVNGLYIAVDVTLWCLLSDYPAYLNQSTVPSRLTGQFRRTFVKGWISKIGQSNFKNFALVNTNDTRLLKTSDVALVR